MKTYERLRFWRQAQNKTLREVATAAGMDEPKLSRVERGKSRLLVEDLERLIGALGIDIHTFYGKIEKPKKGDPWHF